LSILPRDDHIFDRLAIRDLIEFYADRLNHADWDGYATTLMENVVFHLSAPDDWTVYGRDELVEIVRAAYQDGFVHQMAHNIIVDRITGDRARARHTLHVFGTKFRILALYYDGVVRTAEGWKFAHRDVQVTYYEEGDLPGMQYRKLPDTGNPVWFEEFV
jgi:hypothetical protein